MSIQENLNRQIGPLKAWHWGVVVIGAYLLYHFFFKSSGIGGAGLVSDTGSAPGDILPSGGSSGDGSTGSVNPVGGGSTDNSSSNPPIDLTQLPDWAKAAAGQYEANSPQQNAFSNLDVPYLEAGLTDTIAFTPNQARAWWNNWFANPVNLGKVDPNLLPGSLVLSPEEAALARQLQAAGTLPYAPRNYNPLNLSTIPATPTSVEVYTNPAFSNPISAPSTTDTNSTRITQLQAAIKQDQIYLDNLKKAGKTGTAAYKTDTATLASNQQQLAALTIPVGTTSGH